MYTCKKIGPLGEAYSGHSPCKGIQHALLRTHNNRI